mmetsp:Transcript_869/g.3611  ORF Transcript_869/g.3611 Transcript_869/m.3611 type:complete len:545 (+) Transcript_869:285-1919(+)
MHINTLPARTNVAGGTSTLKLLVHLRTLPLDFTSGGVVIVDTTLLVTNRLPGSPLEHHWASLLWAGKVPLADAGLLVMIESSPLLVGVGLPAFGELARRQEAARRADGGIGVAKSVEKPLTDALDPQRNGVLGRSALWQARLRIRPVLLHLGPMLLRGGHGHGVSLLVVGIHVRRRSIGLAVVIKVGRGLLGVLPLHLPPVALVDGVRRDGVLRHLLLHRLQTLAPLPLRIIERGSGDNGWLRLLPGALARDDVVVVHVALVIKEAVPIRRPFDSETLHLLCASSLRFASVPLRHVRPSGIHARRRSVLMSHLGLAEALAWREDRVFAGKFRSPAKLHGQVWRLRVRVVHDVHATDALRHREAEQTATAVLPVAEEEVSGGDDADQSSRHASADEDDRSTGATAAATAPSGRRVVAVGLSFDYRHGGVCPSVARLNKRRLCIGRGVSRSNGAAGFFDLVQNVRVHQAKKRVRVASEPLVHGAQQLVFIEPHRPVACAPRRTAFVNKGERPDHQLKTARKRKDDALYAASTSSLGWIRKLQGRVH